MIQQRALPASFATSSQGCDITTARLRSDLLAILSEIAAWKLSS